MTKTTAARTVILGCTMCRAEGLTYPDAAFRTIAPYLISAPLTEGDAPLDPAILRWLLEGGSVEPIDLCATGDKIILRAASGDRSRKRGRGESSHGADVGPDSPGSTLRPRRIERLLGMSDNELDALLRDGHPEGGDPNKRLRRSEGDRTPAPAPRSPLDKITLARDIQPIVAAPGLSGRDEGALVIELIEIEMEAAGLRGCGDPDTTSRNPDTTDHGRAGTTLDRLLLETASKLDRPETHRRRTTLNHLKVAAAAGSVHPQDRDPRAAIDALRSDLMELHDMRLEAAKPRTERGAQGMGRLILSAAYRIAAGRKRPADGGS